MGRSGGGRLRGISAGNVIGPSPPESSRGARLEEGTWWVAGTFAQALILLGLFAHQDSCDFRSTCYSVFAYRVNIPAVSENCLNKLINKKRASEDTDPQGRA